ncbi:MAG: carboxypeptidase-like regulatory domain-containing protein [Euryarchaeota archaeon]|nr:carboxypeptidase-like regulatory domain-containing protein [Euryarchaeota archaeon]
MHRSLLVAIASLLFIPALAGCLGGDDAPDTTDDDGLCDDKTCDVENKDITKGMGRVEGSVKNADFQDLAGANVTLKELALTTITNEKGKYAFNDLEPGLYTILAAAPGHAPDGRQVEVKPDETTTVDIGLEELPPTAEPYRSSLVENSGMLGCGFSAAKSLRGNPCADLGDENDKNTFTFAMDAGVTAIAMHLEADNPPAKYPDNLEFFWKWDNPPGVPKPITGPTPLSAIKEFEKDSAGWQESPREAKYVILLNKDASSPQFAYQMRFTTWVVVFYNGEPVPSGFSPKPDA